MIMRGEKGSESSNRGLCEATDYMELREVEYMAVEKAIGSSSLAEVIDRILDKGLVVDAWVRVSLVGIELLAIEARVVLAGVDTYLKYAEAVGLTAAVAA